MAHSDCGWTCGCAGETVKFLENTCHTWALLRWWFTTKRRYIKCMHLCFYLYQNHSNASKCKFTSINELHSQSERQLCKVSLT